MNYSRKINSTRVGDIQPRYCGKCQGGCRTSCSGDCQGSCKGTCSGTCKAAVNKK